MMIRRVWIKTIGDNASIAITDHGKRRVTLPNSSTGAPPRPLQRADNGPLFPADDLRRRLYEILKHGTMEIGRGLIVGRLTSL